LRDEAYESLDLDINGWMDENTRFEGWKHTKLSLALNSMYLNLNQFNLQNLNSIELVRLNICNFH
jgi:hypothetical protein